jgi:NAD(P)-dependent dehydrogenase (short-subunit alcohol dehydrogenase family)
MALTGQTILITGAARRVGRHLALTVASAGADVIIHHSNSPTEADEVATAIQKIGRRAWILQADFRRPEQAEELVGRAAQLAPLNGLVNNSSIFAPLSLAQTTLADWQQHMDINLTAPFLLSREFAAHLPAGQKGRIVNIVDWRALRPSGDHFPYTISKAALAALTQSTAVALAPNILVNGMALGAILPPSDQPDLVNPDREIPAGRWARLEEVGQALLFLLDGPEYITGEILYLDGGRHLI